MSDTEIIASAKQLDLFTATNETLYKVFNDEHQLVEASRVSVYESARNGYRHAIRAGEAAAVLKKRTEHGKFMELCAAKFKTAHSTVCDYMRIYEHRDEIEAKLVNLTNFAEGFSINAALKLLEKPRTPRQLPDSPAPPAQTIPVASRPGEDLERLEDGGSDPDDTGQTDGPDGPEDDGEDREPFEAPVERGEIEPYHELKARLRAAFLAVAMTGDVSLVSWAHRELDDVWDQR